MGDEIGNGKKQERKGESTLWVVHLDDFYWRRTEFASENGFWFWLWRLRALGIFAKEESTFESRVSVKRIARQAVGASRFCFFAKAE